MHHDLSVVCGALDQFADAIISTFPFGTDQIFSDHWGWPAPALSRQDFSWKARSIADDLRTADADEYPEALRPWVQHLPQRISVMQTQTLPNTYNGNVQGFSAMFEGLQAIRDRLLPAIGWVVAPNLSSLPAQLARRTTAARRRVEGIESAIPELTEKVAAINAAHQVAENLELDLQALQEAREAVERAGEETERDAFRTAEFALKSEEVLDSIQSRAGTAWSEVQVKSENALDELQKKVQASLQSMKVKEDIAEKLIAKCEEAYHIATTKGLAGAFDQKAASLGKSMQLWVAGLATALIAGSIIGSNRLSSLAAEFRAENPNWPAIIAQMLLAVLGVGAPLWFSWLATKQIGQRFRLSEDYAFKASVAKAYEGYRKEAAVLDPEFQATLFRSALTRLDEAPLRLVEVEQHGSPWSELLKSEIVKEAMKVAPELPAKIMMIASDTLQQAKNAKAEAVKVVEAAKAIAENEEVKKND
jgi:hypothetical protein